jgi:hypothetical protein
LKVHKFLKSRTIPIAAAVITVAIIGVTRIEGLHSERYFVKRIPVSGHIAWRGTDREAGAQRAIVAVNYTSQGRHGSRLRNMLSRVGEVVGAVTEIPEPLQTSMELIAVDFSAAQASSKGITVSTLQSPVPGSMSGHLVTQDGKLYLLGFGFSDDVFDSEEAEDALPEDYVGDYKGWRFENNQFFDITSQEVQTVRESFARGVHLNSPEDQSQASNHSTQWQACTESVYSFRRRSRCPMKAAGSTWTLSFNGANPLSLEGPIFAQLNSGDGVDKVRLTSDANLWVETSAADYSASRNKLLDQLPSYSGSRLVYGWGSYLFGLLVAIGVPFVVIRSALKRATDAKLYFPEARPEDFPGLDSQRLEYYSQFLLAKGFKFLRDFTIASPTPAPNRPPSFCRLFVNPDSKCFAEISQLFTPQKDMGGMHCSFMTTFEGDWRYSTTDRLVDSMSYVARRPRTLWLSRPGMSCEEMLSLHYQMINQMMMKLGVSVVNDASVEGHFLRCSQGVEELNKIIRQKSFWVLPLIVEYQYHAHRRHYEWLSNSGLSIPASPWTPPTEERQDASWLGTVNKWAPVLNFASTVMLGFSAYLMFFRPSHSVAASNFRVGLFVVGLACYALLAIARKKTAKA